MYDLRTEASRRTDRTYTSPEDFFGCIQKIVQLPIHLRIKRHTKKFKVHRTDKYPV